MVFHFNLKIFLPVCVLALAFGFHNTVSAKTSKKHHSMNLMNVSSSIFSKTESTEYAIYKVFFITPLIRDYLQSNGKIRDGLKSWDKSENLTVYVVPSYIQNTYQNHGTYQSERVTVKSHTAGSIINFEILDNDKIACTPISKEFIRLDKENSEYIRKAYFKNFSGLFDGLFVDSRGLLPFMKLTYPKSCLEKLVNPSVNIESTGATHNLKNIKKGERVILTPKKIVLKQELSPKILNQLLTEL